MIDFTVLGDNWGGNNADSGVLVLSHEQFEGMIDYSLFASGNVLVDEDAKSVIEQSFLLLTGNPQEAEELSFGNTGWQISIMPNLVKSSVVASLMIGLLYAAGATQLVSLVLPAVLPLLIDIDSIKLSVKDNLILSEMRRHENLKRKEFLPQEIYDQLDAQTQGQFTFAEFLEVLNVLSLTGDMNWDEKTGLFEINDKKKFRISIR